MITKYKKVLSKKIGILGGLGPYAHIELEKNILSKTRKCLQRSYLLDKEYPEFIVVSSGCSYPFHPNNNKQLPKKLIDNIKLLNRTKVDFIILTCNTLHCHIDELQTYSKVPILNIIQLTCDYIKTHYSIDNILGLIGTSTTLNNKLYHKHLQQYNILTPQQLNINIPDEFFAYPTHGAHVLENAIKLLTYRSDLLIIGCTDITPLLNQYRWYQQWSHKIIDPLKIVCDYIYDINNI